MIAHVGTNDGKILPKRLYDQKVPYTIGIQKRFFKKLLFTDYYNYAVPKLERKNSTQIISSNNFT